MDEKKDNINNAADYKLLKIRQPVGVLMCYNNHR